jgi:hypothetical protein
MLVRKQLDKALEGVATLIHLAKAAAPSLDNR